MSEKKLKLESANSSILLQNITLPILSLICSFIGVKRRAKHIELCCRALKAASRHPSSFAGSVCNFELLRNPYSDGGKELARFCGLYSTPPLRAIRFISNGEDDEDTAPDFSVIIGTFHHSLVTLQMGSPGPISLFLWRAKNLLCLMQTCATSRRSKK